MIGLETVIMTYFQVVFGPMSVLRVLKGRK